MKDVTHFETVEPEADWFGNPINIRRNLCNRDRDGDASEAWGEVDCEACLAKRAEVES